MFLKGVQKELVPWSTHREIEWLDKFYDRRGMDKVLYRDFLMGYISAPRVRWSGIDKNQCIRFAQSRLAKL